MNYTLMPSLERFALIKTAITLWKADDSSIHRGVWKVPENHVTEKVKELQLPESLKKKLLGFIRPIRIEMCNFFNDHRHYLCCEAIGIEECKSIMMDPLRTLFDEVRVRNIIRKSFKKLCWTAQGTVDTRKTVEGLIRDEDLSIKTCYILACINCLENDIVMLWNKMPEDLKKYFYNEEDPRLISFHGLAVLWTYEIKGEVARMHCISEREWPGCTPYQYAFCCAVSRGYKAATGHFLQKLTSEERKECLERRSVFPNKGIACFLLSQMSEVEQAVICREHHGKVLNCLLDWPFQGLFIEMAKHLLLVDDAKYSYYSLLVDIIDKVKDGFKDYNYQELFSEFWQLIPITDKRPVIFRTTYHNGELLRTLLSMKDYENVKLILKDAIALDREKLLFFNRGKQLCGILINADEMDLLEFVVLETISSKDLLIKFREEYERYLLRNEREKFFFIKAFHLLYELEQKFDKRKCVEEGNNGPVKRLCSFISE